MKTHSDAMLWVNSILDLSKNLPDGVGIRPYHKGSEQGMYVFYNLLHEDVIKIASEFNVEHTLFSGYTSVDVVIPKGSSKKDLKENKAFKFRFIGRKDKKLIK